jgi:hypothetical protein
LSLVSGDAQLVSAESDPGSLNSVWVVKVKIIPVAGGVGGVARLARFTLTFGGHSARSVGGLGKSGAVISGNLSPGEHNCAKRPTPPSAAFLV